jgi:hypothetical protein
MHIVTWELVRARHDPAGEGRQAGVERTRSQVRVEVRFTRP